jgi:hypothetical protein
LLISTEEAQLGGSQLNCRRRPQEAALTRSALARDWRARPQLGVSWP